MLMRSVYQFYGPNGEKLEELQLLDAETGAAPTDEQIKAEMGDTPEPSMVYLGMLMIPVAIQGRNGEVIAARPQEMRFPIEAATRKEAFERYESAAQAAIAQLKAEQEAKAKAQQAPQLLVPNAAQSEAINKLKLVTD